MVEGHARGTVASTVTEVAGAPVAHLLTDVLTALDYSALKMSLINLIESVL